jgi:acetyl esterase/lipase
MRGWAAVAMSAAASAAAGAASTGCVQPEVLHDVSYDDRFGAATTMDVYLPPDDAVGRPAVLAVHGGGWRLGDKKLEEPLCRRLARSGFVCVSINYRLVPDGAYPAAIQDTKCALIFLRAHADDYGLDAERVAVTGYSAGGHLASLVAVSEGVTELEPDCEVALTSGEPARVAASIPGAGVHEMRPLSWSAPVRDFLGGSPDDVPERYDLASPIWHVAPGLPPMLLIHGSSDLFVPVQQAEDMYDAMRAAGNDVRFLKMTGASHLWQPGDDAGFWALDQAAHNTDAWAATIDFLYETLGPP